MCKILIVNKEQYGYHIDTYKYCVYLLGRFDVTYICWDEGKSRIATEGVNCIYLKKKGSLFNRFFILTKSVNREIKFNNYNIIFIVYFKGCSLLKLSNLRSTFNLDIRTIAVTEKKLNNFLLDKLLKVEILFFNHITVISQETGKQIGIKKFLVLPLGGESLAKYKLSFNNLNLIYVGTLSNRNIMDLIKGFKLYLVNYSNQRNETLTIIGDGYNNELAVLNHFIKEYDMMDFIFTTGYVNNDKLGSFFEKATCGVSYVPITPYYENQPPTKTYEYLLSGLPVLATNTRANAKIIHDLNGVLIQDNVESVAKGIFEISNKLSSYDSNKIKEKMESSLWVNIVNNILYPYLTKITTTNKT